MINSGCFNVFKTRVCKYPRDIITKITECCTPGYIDHDRLCIAYRAIVRILEGWQTITISCRFIYMFDQFYNSDNKRHDSGCCKCFLLHTTMYPHITRRLVVLRMVIDALGGGISKRQKHLGVKFRIFFGGGKILGVSRAGIYFNLFHKIMILGCAGHFTIFRPHYYVLVTLNGSLIRM